MKKIISPLFGALLTVLVITLSSNLFISASRGDQAEVEQGKKVFQERGCTACHSIGKGKITGPDLLGVTQRRDEEWLKKWLKSPDTMIMTDPVAKEMPLGSGNVVGFGQRAEVPRSVGHAQVDEPHGARLAQSARGGGGIECRPHVPRRRPAVACLTRSGGRKPGASPGALGL